MIRAVQRRQGDDTAGPEVLILDDSAKLASATSDPDAFASIYAQLKNLALAHMAREAPGHSWSPTVLVHELYLRSGLDAVKKATSKGEYLSFASKAMRNILVDHARSRRAAKRGVRKSPIVVGTRTSRSRSRRRRSGRT